MKTILFYFMLVILTVSCQLRQSENSENSIAEDSIGIETEVLEADSIKATAIFWIDKSETKNLESYTFRTIKAKVFIHEDGKIELQSFIKKQTPNVEKYIRDHLSTFEVPDKMFEGGYIKTGEQYVQLRCVLEMIRKQD